MCSKGLLIHKNYIMKSEMYNMQMLNIKAAPISFAI